MQGRCGALRAALVVGLFHGLWHLPSFLLANGPGAGGPFNPYRLVLNTAIIMVVTMMWAWVFNNAGQSILIAVLLHASSDAAQQLRLSWIPGFPKQAQNTVLAMYAVIAVALIAATKRHLGFQR
jgi:membrane protease YdiL (CAAX protease family)